MNNSISKDLSEIKLTYLLDCALIEVFRRIILILDEYFDNKNKEWVEDLTMHSAALFENRFIKKDLT